NSRTAMPHTNFSVSEAIFHRPMVRQRMEFRIYPSIFFLTNRKSLLGGVHAPACGLNMKGLRPLHSSPGLSPLFLTV
ncbi:MAG: hypothetical protein ACI4XW_10235, partial [Candidatus Spyradocola sp.]